MCLGFSTVGVLAGLVRPIGGSLSWRASTRSGGGVEDVYLLAVVPPLCVSGNYGLVGADGESITVIQLLNQAQKQGCLIR